MQARQNQEKIASHVLSKELLEWGYIGDYCISVVGFGVSGLGSTLLKGGYIGGDIGESIGPVKGDTRSLD